MLFFIFLFILKFTEYILNYFFLNIKYEMKY